MIAGVAVTAVAAVAAAIMGFICFGRKQRGRKRQQEASSEVRGRGKGGLWVPVKGLGLWVPVKGLQGLQGRASWLRA